MTPHLEQFAHQLARWAQEMIDHGRTPFRRVDCLADIVTDVGTLQPPLTFWINRQSMMAGGVLLLPDKDLSAELQRGRNCADALGLSHFVTWESEQVRLWNVSGDTINECQRFPLPGADHPDFFRHLLKEVLEALKIPAVTGALPHNKLSSSYFINLFNIALELAQPAMTEVFRRQRAEETPEVFIDIDQRALEANRFQLLQILTALRFNLLPDTVLPEDLGQVVTSALKRAPESISNNFSYNWEGAPTQLPMETAICYHHLLLRLQQLRWTSSAERMRQSLIKLISQWFPDPQDQEAVPADIILYPQGPVSDSNLHTIVSDCPLVLASTALTRELGSLPQTKAWFGSLISLDSEQLSPGRICAHVLDRTPLTRDEKALYSGRLRLSWPHRNFKILADQARWKWELIHLLGLSHQDHFIRVETPMELLDITAEEPLWSLVSTNFHINNIITGEHTLMLDLVRSTIATNPTRIYKLDGTVREIFLSADPIQLRQQIVDTILPPGTVERQKTSLHKSGNQVSKNLNQEIIDQLNVHGIPNFPDQYLYFLEHSDTTQYRITPPLRETSKLLDRFELEDAHGQIIQGIGEELQQALTICAQTGKTTFDLPKNRTDLEKLLLIYRKDLSNLYQQLCDLSYRQIKKPQAARNLIRSIWKKLALPDPEWFKN